MLGTCFSCFTIVIHTIRRTGSRDWRTDGVTVNGINEGTDTFDNI